MSYALFVLEVSVALICGCWPNLRPTMVSFLFIISFRLERIFLDMAYQSWFFDWQQKKNYYKLKPRRKADMFFVLNIMSLLHVYVHWLLEKCQKSFNGSFECQHFQFFKRSKIPQRMAKMLCLCFLFARHGITTWSLFSWWLM